MRNMKFLSTVIYQALDLDHHVKYRGQKQSVSFYGILSNSTIQPTLSITDKTAGKKYEITSIHENNITLLGTYKQSDLLGQPHLL